MAAAMASVWAAALFALFLWWFFTGAILVAVKHADRAAPGAHRRLAIASLPALALGWLVFLWSLEEPSLLGVYAAFVSSLVIWGWFELAFLCGVVTGPVSTPNPPRVSGLERFLRAWGAIAYSEMALLASMLAIGVLAWGAPNTVSLWTFALLFFARISAKLNLFLGVANVNVEFLPKPMRHLACHFRRAPMNALFPVSVTLLSAATGCWIERLTDQASGSPGAAGFALLATLSALALFEHWLMVLPIPDARLWRWLLPAPNQDARDRSRGGEFLREKRHGL